MIRNPIGRPSRHVFGTRQGRYTDSWVRAISTLHNQRLPRFPQWHLLIVAPNYRCEGSDGIAARFNRAPIFPFNPTDEYCQAPLTLLKHPQYYTWGGHGKLFTQLKIYSDLQRISAGVGFGI